MTDKELEGWLTVTEAAKRMGLSTGRTRQLCKERRLEYAKNQSGHFRINPDSCDAYTPGQGGPTSAFRKYVLYIEPGRVAELEELLEEYQFEGNRLQPAYKAKPAAE